MRKPLVRATAALGVACLLITGDAATADPIIVPLPLDSAVSLDLNANPVVRFGNRTIDFTAALNQQFIAFLPEIYPVSTEEIGPAFRATIGVRARDGLSMLTGMFPLSPDPTFTNTVPTFLLGTTNLIAFDVIIPGWKPFSVSVVDVNGVTHSASFGAPVPEPGSLLLIGVGLGLIARSRQRRNSVPDLEA